MKKEHFGTIFLLIATLTYSINGILSRTVGFSIPLYFQNTTRQIIPIVALLPFFIATIKHPFTGKSLLLLLIRSYSFVFAFLLYFLAINAMPLGISYFIFYSALTISGFVVGKLVFKEIMSVNNIAGLVFACIGLFSIYAFDNTNLPLLYIFYAFISGFLTTIWNTMSKYLDRFSFVELTLYDSFFSMLTFGIISLFIAKETWTMPNFSPTWLASMGIGIGFLVTGVTIPIGFRHLDANVASLVMLSEIVFMILIGWVLYHESMQIPTIIGGIFIILGMALPYIKLPNRFVKQYQS